MISKVVSQIIEDSKFCADRRRKRPKQFIHMLHGGPGTGKSHVIKILKEKLFEEEYIDDTYLSQDLFEDTHEYSSEKDHFSH